MIKYPSTTQFSNVIRNIRHKAQYIGTGKDNPPTVNRQARMPVLNFRGTVKLHGTNSSIVFGEDITFQSRNREMTIDSDHYGFVDFMVNNVGYETLSHLEMEVLAAAGSKYDSNVVIYGEWCGEGIQKGVALKDIPKMFVIFAIQVFVNQEGEWLDSKVWEDIQLPEHNIYNINRFQTFSLDIDFNNPTLVQNTLRELTEKVEKECPVGKHFGVSGVGEGIVWKCSDPRYSGSDFWMKVKGAKHSASKVKTLASVDVEKVKSIQEFMSSVLTESRLNQGIEYLIEMKKPIDQKATGDFLSWVFKDIQKEEGEVMAASGITRKDIGAPIGVEARQWFFNKLDKLAFNNQ